MYFVTNNEVDLAKQSVCESRLLSPGDSNGKNGESAITSLSRECRLLLQGRRLRENPIEGEYKFNDEFPMSDGFEENAEFFTLTYESPIAVNHNLAFSRIAPLLWLSAGSRGKRIDKLPTDGWAVVELVWSLVDVDTATSS